MEAKSGGTPKTLLLVTIEVYKRMDRSKKLLLGAVVVAAFVAYLMFSGLGSSYGYATPKELASGEKQGEMVSVMGNVSTGTVEHEPMNNILRFELEGNETSIQVVYEGAIPANFAQGITVVAKGQYDGDVFHAEKLIVKCPSKYEQGSPEDG